MNRLEFVDRLSLEESLSRDEAKLIVEMFFDLMAQSLAKGDRVEIRGFCSFYVKNYRSYMGRNPKTGEKVMIKSKKLPFFKCGSDLRNSVDFDK